jgi:hypothetical protein
VTATHLARLRVSKNAEAPLGAPALNGAWPRDLSFPTWAVVLMVGYGLLAGRSPDREAEFQPTQQGGGRR